MRRLVAWILAGWALPMVAGELVRVGVVVLEEGARVPQAAQQEMRRETTRILDLKGVQFEWPDLNRLARGEPLHWIVVVRFVRGGETGIGLQGEGGTLGETEVREGRALPFVTVDVERVRSVVGRSRARRRTDGQLGRAVGRVLAHELYHALSGCVEHDEEGVAKASLSGDELSLGYLQLGEAARIRLMKRLRSGHQVD